MTQNLTVPVRALEAVLGLTAATAHERFTRLSPRERKVAELLAAGKSNREIAAELRIGIKTVHIHRAQVRIKLLAGTLAGIANVVNLVRLVGVVD